LAGSALARLGISTKALWLGAGPRAARKGRIKTCSELGILVGIIEMRLEERPGVLGRSFLEKRQNFPGGFWAG
jgi:hypothetical protein